MNQEVSPDFSWSSLRPIAVPPRLRRRYHPDEVERLTSLSERLRGLHTQGQVTVDLVAHDNRRTLVSLRRLPTGRQLTLRLHWALLLDTETCLQLTLWGARNGDLPTWCRDWMLTWLRQKALRPRLADDRSGAESTLATNLLTTNLSVVSTWAGLDAPPEGTQPRWMAGPFRVDASRVRLGAADTLRHEIRVHPVLSLPEIPLYCLQSVLYHELCHLLSPPLTPSEARQMRERRIHHRAFDTLTEADPYALQRDAWMQKNLRRMLALGRRRGLL